MKKMKNLNGGLPPKARPYLMILIALIPLMAVWAVYGSIVRRQSETIELLRQQAPASGAPTVAEPQTTDAPAPAPASEPTIAPAPKGSGGTAPTPFAAPTTVWRTAVSPDGEYQVSLPSGTKLVQSEGMTYVMADPTPA